MDKFLIDRLDAAATALQRRGWSLVNGICYSAAASLFSNLAMAIVNKSSFGFFLGGGVFLILLVRATTWAEGKADYQSDWRLTKSMNVEVSQNRSDHKFGRLLWFCSLAAVIPLSAIQMLGGESVAKTLFLLSSWAAPTFAVYLKTSTFVMASPQSEASLSRDVAPQSL